MTEYPEHEKLEKIMDKSQVVGEFIEWLMYIKDMHISEYHEHSDICYEDGERICGMSENNLYPISEKADDLLAEFFGIDQKKITEEKEAMYQEMKATNAKS
jgi:hypothetical protein